MAFAYCVSVAVRKTAASVAQRAAREQQAAGTYNDDMSNKGDSLNKGSVGGNTNPAEASA